mmetsp:Transcript_15165/g.37718  ORF Transcript_15165/g.37718 Transcript_15165/m.37718 type:complete len:227 (+) Transcript_15165:110-790(+)|eukprot:CAMPEP_0178995618 /NCGR_PEP_ID=MMETSP0795-20121207/7918_1 /TAXON_ID=88552 /ORGANISM="Amoebophrya sp., Strain Ameob2" /LENGTH=226 /DNA_ID=CAMNT_0020687927 /DNA_START=208 /DNA_END=891 /DNA_ORIENTATION=+
MLALRLPSIRTKILLPVLCAPFPLVFGMAASRENLLHQTAAWKPAFDDSLTKPLVPPSTTLGAEAAGRDPDRKTKPSERKQEREPLRSSTGTKAAESFIQDQEDEGANGEILETTSAIRPDRVTASPVRANLYGSWEHWVFGIGACVLLVCIESAWRRTVESLRQAALLQQEKNKTAENSPAEGEGMLRFRLHPEGSALEGEGTGTIPSKGGEGSTSTTPSKVAAI